MNLKQITMKQFIYAVIVLAITISCKENKTNTLQPLVELQGSTSPAITLDSLSALPLLKEEPTRIVVNTPVLQSADTIVESYRYIALETTAESLIGNIDKICTDSGFIFVYDHDNNLLLSFDDTGKFLGKIGKQGRGPEEYIEIWSMTLDKQKKEVCLLDLAGRKLMYFNYEGEHVKTEPMYYLFTDFEFIGDKRVVFTGSSHNNSAPLVNLHRLLVAENNQKPLYRGFPITIEFRERFNLETYQSLRKFEDEVYYYHVLADTIWQIKENGYVAKYTLDFPQRGVLFTPQDIQQITLDIYKKKNENKDVFSGKYLFTKDFLFFGIANKHGIQEPLVVDRKTGNTRYGLFLPGYKTSQLGDYWVNSGFDFTYNDTSFIRVLQPYSMKRTVNSLDKETYSYICQKDKDMVNRIKEEDNPVLMIMDLKKF